MKETKHDILILDDYDGVRVSMVDYFEDRGWSPLAASNAEEALELMKTHQPAAALVDIRLGTMTGDVFIRKAHGQSPYTVFVICTGSPDFELPPDLIALPQVFNNIFVKPIKLSVLEEEIQKLITSDKEWSDE